jgi:hypothetical protein
MLLFRVSIVRLHPNFVMAKVQPPNISNTSGLSIGLVELDFVVDRWFGRAHASTGVDVACRRVCEILCPFNLHAIRRDSLKVHLRFV